VTSAEAEETKKVAEPVDAAVAHAAAVEQLAEAVAHDTPAAAEAHSRSKMAGAWIWKVQKYRHITLLVQRYLLKWRREPGTMHDNLVPNMAAWCHALHCIGAYGSCYTCAILPCYTPTQSNLLQESNR
jgi:uncharacterized protein YcaQ